MEKKLLVIQAGGIYDDEAVIQQHPPTPSCPRTGVKNWNHFIGDWDVGAPLFQRPVAVVLFCSSEVFADVYLAHVTLSSTLDCGGSCNVIAAHIFPAAVKLSRCNPNP